MGATIETWAERMIAQGAERGASEGERALLLRLMGTRFGSVPEAARRSIDAADRQTVELLAEALVLAPSLEAFIAQLP